MRRIHAFTKIVRAADDIDRGARFEQRNVAHDKRPVWRP